MKNLCYLVIALVLYLIAKKKERNNKQEGKIFLYLKKSNGNYQGMCFSFVYFAVVMIMISIGRKFGLNSRKKKIFF